MGFNTGILLLNDALYAAEQDKEGFATNLLRAIGEQVRHKPYDSVDFAIGNNVNGGTVFWQTHADVTGVVAIGQNCTTTLFSRWNTPQHHTYDGQVEILREIAASLGYNISRKQKKNIPS